MLFNQLINLSFKEALFRTLQGWYRLLDRFVISKSSNYDDVNIYLSNPYIRGVDSFLNSKGFAGIEQSFFSSFSSPEETKKLFFQHFPKNADETKQYKYTNRLSKYNKQVNR